MEYTRIPENDNEKEKRLDNILLATRASWIVNWFLFGVKLYVVIFSRSKSVVAALVDSAVDLISQWVLSSAEMRLQIHEPSYPVGRTRLEALGVLACASVMIMASIEVIQYSFTDIYNGFFNNEPQYIDGDFIMFVILAIGTIFKLILYFYCQMLNYNSDTLAALAEDHLNDVMSNATAIVTASLAIFYTKYWYIDQIGAILISLVIIYRWIDVISDQVKKIVGHTATPEFIDEVTKLAHEHDSRIIVDITRAYHFGKLYIVEIEIILPELMTVRESHDIALALQHKIEQNEMVERAFVHVDYAKRDGLEHKVERELVFISENKSNNKDDLIAQCF
mmetsp:Transcript_15713/g.16456  ORF Transcript_15713/g.16456 Transcript_15713/m.16456 type:complete len:336 (+) Transcript_15713:28-1035(+)